MTALRLAFLLLLPAVAAGCPHPQIHVADVTTKTTVISDALVVAHCRETVHASGRTDRNGRATLKIFSPGDPEDCQIVVAKPGFETLEQQGASLCQEGKTCPPTRYILRRVGGTK